METKELLKKVRKIEIKTRGLSRHIFAGQYHSAFKGRGITFSEVREYRYGDDTRSIDWNVTARFNHPYVKVFEEERELTVMLLVDVSGSRNFGTVSQLRRNIITEISAVLAFSAIQNNDKTGVLFFSDQVEKFIPPKKGSRHILHIIRELIEFEPHSNHTDLSIPLKYLTNAIKKRCTAFILSDFLCPDFEDSLKIANRKHDVVAIRINDRREKDLPPVGLVKFMDPETMAYRWIDTSVDSVRKTYQNYWRKYEKRLNEILAKSNVDHISINTSDDYVKPLIAFFKKR